MLKKDLGYRHLVTQICYVHVHPEQSLITLQLENIDLDFFLEKNLIPKKKFKYPCSLYPIKSQRYILYDCRRFNGY